MSEIQLHSPGDPIYREATSPDNSSGAQTPAFVARPRDAEELAEAVRRAAALGLRARPQATGHGAGGVVGDDTLLIDTSALTALTISAGSRIARAGAGLQWGRINPVAEKDGLLGLAGSSPTVAISGYTFGGGIGFLTRPHGMASSALRRVEFVDGHGRIRIAADDAPDPRNRDALWAFRGGGGVGVASSLEFDLVEVRALFTGYLLWPIDALDAVVAAWGAAMDEVSADVATSIGVLHLPPAPAFPEALRGKPVVHLAVAASEGEDGARPLLERVRAAATPAVDTWGPGDAATLAQIHLDPPSAVPAIGDGRWLTADAPAVAASALSLAADPDSALALIEFRSVGNSAPARPGAETQTPGPYIAHAVGALTAPDRRPAIDGALESLRAALAPADLGRSAGSWVEGSTSVPDALPTEIRDRVIAIADDVDPDGVLTRSRLIS